MSWWRLIPGLKIRPAGVGLLRLRCTRFRQLLRNYGRILDLMADAAEKQGGDYILDKQYIVSLGEVLFDLADSIVFDLNVMTEMQNLPMFENLQRLRKNAREIMSAPEGGKVPADRDRTDDRTPRSKVDAESLARSISRFPVLFRHGGQVACRGVASGPAFNLETEQDPAGFPEGGVLVAADFKPDDELIRIMRRASAILTDFGKPASHTARLARDFRIPAIVGLSDVSARVRTGEVVTVDADENTVYRGRIEELHEYYRGESLGPEEEFEYRLLRRLRRAVFPLTVSEKKGGAAGGFETVHDIIHVAHELAGEALVDMIWSRKDIKKKSVAVEAGTGRSIRAVDLGGGLREAAGAEGAAGMDQVRSHPFKAFISGLAGLDRESGPEMENAGKAPVTAAVMREHVNLRIAFPGGFDLLDSVLSDAAESNYIYCRIAAGSDEAPGRGEAARLILDRLDFAAAGTDRAVTAWIGGLDRSELARKLEVTGRLFSFFDCQHPGGREAGSSVSAEEFIKRHA